ncbi:MAG TPA: hypothetical protein PKA74_10335, partial [Bauldia sp.]|nr:hypothetical protein [Bauldia sp.]
AVFIGFNAHLEAAHVAGRRREEEPFPDDEGGDAQNGEEGDAERDEKAHPEPPGAALAGGAARQIGRTSDRVGGTSDPALRRHDRSRAVF